MSPTQTFDIPIAKPWFTGNEAEALQQALNSGWVSQGPVVQRFEQAIAQATGARHAVAFTSWTTAMHTAMLLYGIGPGDEVLCPSYSFIATANVIRHAGAEPRFVDIDADTLNMDPLATRALIDTEYAGDPETGWVHKDSGRRLKAVQVVHQIGIPADIDGFADLACQYNLVLLEDSACALGSVYRHQPIGSSGFTGALSFHPRKVITTGEGGMLLLEHPERAEKARVYRTHGMSVSDLARHQSRDLVFETYEVVGYNYKLTDLQAALGLCQLELLEAILRRRQEIAIAYNRAFAELPELSVITPPGYVTRWNAQSYPIRLTRGTVNDRNVLMSRLQERGVATRRGIPPAHKEPAYAGHNGLTLPDTERVSATSLFLPIFPQMTEPEVTHVIASVRESLKGLLA